MSVRLDNITHAPLTIRPGYTYCGIKYDTATVVDTSSAPVDCPECIEANREAELFIKDYDASRQEVAS